MKKIQLAVVAILMSASFTFAQGPALKFPAASPAQTIKQEVGISAISVEYSRPSGNGRTIFGGVVPFDQFWRTGANGPTKITFDSDVVIGGSKVQAGTYCLFTYPSKNEWNIVLNKNLNVRSQADHNKDLDVANFKVKSTTTAGKTEVFTIDFAKVASNLAIIELKWENTAVAFDVTFDYDQQLTTSIEKALATDTRPYYQAARYYFENKKDLKKAFEWVTIAYDQQPYAYWVGMLKAKIQLELKDKKGALMTLEAVKKNSQMDAGTAAAVEDLIKQTK